jgi:tetratricopeptide (TPR) repeat protein
MSGTSGQISNFNNQRTIRTILIGSDVHCDQIRKSLNTLHFVQMTVARNLEQVDREADFLIVAADFMNLPALQSLANFMTRLTDFTGEKLIFATNPPRLSNEELLFGVELGVAQTMAGLRRDDDLKDYIKKKAIDITKSSSASYLERGLLNALKNNNKERIKLFQDKLAKMDKGLELVHRLMFMTYEHQSDHKRMEYHLRQVLALNPLNLWAANKLGCLYLKTNRAGEGISILKKMSRYHELNAERMLVLGHAYLNCGAVDDAAQTLEKGRVLTAGQDDRFTEGLARVDAIRGEPSKALAKIGKSFLSPSILSFLNTRAIMAVRNGEIDEGLRLYKQALQGNDPNELVIHSKILFNQGLAFAKGNAPESAEKSFAMSLTLGGDAFKKAERPLAITRQVIAKKQSFNMNDLEHEHAS